MARKARKPKKVARPIKPRANPYVQIFEGEWIEPVKRGFVHACCDCALVHVQDFYASDDGRVFFRTRVDRRLTAAGRRANKVKRHG
jgi:Zn-finger protein